MPVAMTGSVLEGFWKRSTQEAKIVPMQMWWLPHVIREGHPVSCFITKTMSTQCRTVTAKFLQLSHHVTLNTELVLCYVNRYNDLPLQNHQDRLSHCLQRIYWSGLQGITGLLLSGLRPRLQGITGLLLSGLRPRLQGITGLLLSGLRPRLQGITGLLLSGLRPRLQGITGLLLSGLRPRFGNGSLHVIVSIFIHFLHQIHNTVARILTLRELFFRLVP